MDDQETSIISALRREPEQTAFLFKLSAVTALALVAWDVMAGWVLPAIAVTAVMALVVLLYGGAMTYLVARIMASSRQWASDSAVTASKLSGQTRTGRHRDGIESLRKRPEELPPIEDDDAAEDSIHELRPEPQVALSDSTAFNESYFLMRLQEEVKDARRNGREMCVAAVHVMVPGGPMTPELAQSVAYEMARIASGQSRLMSQPLALNDGEFVFSLPHTGPNETKQFVRDIMRAFGDYWCYFGVAAFPRNATDPVGLVERARAACETSLQSGKRGQVEYSAA